MLRVFSAIRRLSDVKERREGTILRVGAAPLGNIGAPTGKIGAPRGRIAAIPGRIAAPTGTIGAPLGRSGAPKAARGAPKAVRTPSTPPPFTLHTLHTLPTRGFRSRVSRQRRAICLAPLMVVTLGAVAEPASAQPLLVTRVGNANNVSESGVFAPAIGLPNGQIRWNVVTNTVENLPGYLGAIQTSPQHISGDGSVLVGIAVDNDGRQSKYRWTAASGFINLIGQGSVTDLSDDAQTTVGFSNSAAVRWLGASQSPVGLGTPQGWTNSFAYGTNADGTVIVGWATTPSGQRAFRWTQATGMQDLGVLPGSSTSEASAVSGDGLVIVGSVSPPRIAFRWTAAGGMQSLGTFSGQINSTAVMVSGDGSVILGTSGSAPFIWTPWLGMTPLLSYLQSVGVNMAGWTGITLKGISSDGGTIVGTGIFGSQFLSFAVTGLDFTPPCPADFDGDGTVNSQDFFDFLAAFFMLQPAADFNHDAFINSQDFFDFLAAFFAGC